MQQVTHSIGCTLSVLFLAGLLGACSGSSASGPDGLAVSVVRSLQSKDYKKFDQYMFHKQDIKFMLDSLEKEVVGQSKVDQKTFARLRSMVAARIRSTAEEGSKLRRKSFHRALEKARKLGIDWNSIKVEKITKSHPYRQEGVIKMDKVTVSFVSGNKRFDLVIGDIKKVGRGWVSAGGVAGPFLKSGR